MTEYAEQIAKELRLRSSQVAAVIDLLDDDNTIPFIARYRKELTGSLDEEQLRQINESLGRRRSLDERRQTILRSIKEQEKLTPELESQIMAAETMTSLEDLYLPYKPKRRTRAMMAKEKGLEPLAELILMQVRSPKTAEQLAEDYLSEAVPTVEEALTGARDIVAETISDHAEVRQRVREKAWQFGILHSHKIEDAADERKVYELYYEYQEQLPRLRPHQILAINRGETEKILRVKVEIFERDWLLAVRSVFRPNPRSSPMAEQMHLAIEDCAHRLLLPSIERDMRRRLTEKAEAHAIHVFAQNLKNLLNQPPLTGYNVLGIDPGFRTGCKVAVVDGTGKVLETTTIYPHPPQKRREDALKILATLVARHHVTLITIGNGTASRDTEQVVAELTRKLESVHYLIVDESGASVYSASKLAKNELPDLDVTMRGAVSIARRAQDPLAELVKIDPKSIGVGLYQHDVNQKLLSASLNGVVETVVNQVGVDVNTASPALLTHVSGIGPKLAERIVSYRNENGRFINRNTLRNVKGLGAKAFEQSAGFLRIRAGTNPLDASAIHPESYKIATLILERANLPPGSAPDERKPALEALKQETPLKNLATELETGVPTLTDIWEQLMRPGRDPREDLPLPVLRSDVLSMADLQPDMYLEGTVRNMVDFGAFIDIGVKQDGLLHRSQIPKKVQLKVGDIVSIKILKVDTERQRISLGWP